MVPESKMIEKHGGYKFTVPVVPSTFNFGGSAPGMNWVLTFPSFSSPFLTLWLIVVKWKKACVVPSSSGSRTGSSDSLFNLTINLDSTRRCGEGNQMQPMAGKNKPWTFQEIKMKNKRSSEQCCLMESIYKRDTMTAALFLPTYMHRGL